MARALAVALAAVLAGAAADPAVSLRVDGQVDKPLTLSAADIARLPRRTVETKDHEGKPGRFEGVVLADVLELAGAPVGDTLRGAQMSKYLLVQAADDYRAVFALAELAPGFTDEVVLLADRRDGQPLGANEGPLRLVVPHDKRQARWVRQVTRLTVVDAPRAP